MGSSEIVSTNQFLEHINIEEFKQIKFDNEIPTLINLIFKIFTDQNHPLYQ